MSENTDTPRQKCIHFVSTNKYIPTTPGNNHACSRHDVPHLHTRSTRRKAGFPSFDIKQYWHRRQHSDVANQWLRGLVQELFSGADTWHLSASEPSKRTPLSRP